MKKVLGLITLFLCVTLFIWANFIVTAEDMVVEEITAEDEVMVIQNEDTKDYELARERESFVDAPDKE